LDLIDLAKDCCYAIFLFPLLARWLLFFICLAEGFAVVLTQKWSPEFRYARRGKQKVKANPADGGTSPVCLANAQES
jgi:hypothetical protein